MVRGGGGICPLGLGDFSFLLSFLFELRTYEFKYINLFFNAIKIHLFMELCCL